MFEAAMLSQAGALGAASAGFLTLSAAAAAGLYALGRVIGSGPFGQGDARELYALRSLAPGGEWVELDTGERVAVLLVHGIGHDNVPAERLKKFESERAGVVAALWERGAVLRLVARRVPAVVDVHGEFRSRALAEIHRLNLAAFARSYQTRRYLVVSHRGTETAFREIVQETVDRLRSFGVEPVQGPALVQWYAALFDPDAAVGAVSAGELGAAVSGVEPVVDLGRGLVSVPRGMGWLHHGVMSARLWDEDDGHSLVEGLLALPHALTLCLIGKGLPRGGGRLEKRKKVVVAQRPNSEVAKDFTETLTLVDAGRIVMGECGLIVVLRGETVGEVEAGMSGVREVFARVGHKVVPERRAAGYQFMATVPGAHARLVRPRELSSVNVGRLWRWSGRADGAWDAGWMRGPVRVFPEWSGGAYAFQFHLVERGWPPLGNVLLVGGAGEGKTTLAAHLLGGAVRNPKVAVLAFDRNHGLRVWAEAVGGRYLNPADPSSMSLNPFAVPDTGRERTFLRMFLAQLAQGAGDGHDVIQRALDKIMAVPRASRTLQNTWASAFEDGPVKSALRRWADPRDVGGLVNGETDSLSFRQGEPVVIDLTQISADPQVMTPIMTLVMHRMREAAGEGTPHVIFGDEGGALLQDRSFAKNIKEFYRELRKNLGVFILGLQEIAPLVESGVSDAVLKNTAVQLFYPPAVWDADEWKIFKFTEEETAFMSGDHPCLRGFRRPIMCRRREGTAFIETDLRSLGGWLRVYEGGPEPVARMNRLRQEHGERWLEALVGE